MVERLLNIIAVGVLFACAADALEAGAAKVEITPDLGTPLAGSYQRMGRGAVAVHDSLWVRALYLDDGDTRVFLVSADLCVISPALREAALERAPKEVPRENIILTATHTMNGPGGMVKPLAFRILTGRYMPELVELTATRFADAMRAAYDNRKRATVGFATSNQDGLSRNTMVTGGPVDAQLGVLRVNDSDGKAIALMGNFGAQCIGTEIPGPEMLTLSADYPGHFCAELERLAEGCVAMFLQGACGDVVCANPAKATGWAHAESVGKLLAQRAFETAQSIKSDDLPIEVAQTTAALPPTLAGAYLPATAILATLEVGSLAMTFIPGAPCAEIARGLRENCLERDYAAHFTVSMANDYRFFFVPHSQYAIPGRETMLSFYGPAMGDWFCTEFSRLMSHGAADVVAVGGGEPQVDTKGGVRRIIMRGPSYQMGYARGAAFRDELLKEFEQRYATRIASGALVPGQPFWADLPGFVQQYLAIPNVTVPWAAMGARPMLAGLPDELFDEIAGAAAGADMPFDAAWLVQCGPMMEAFARAGESHRQPFGTLFAAVGLKAGADDILIGHNLDWPESVNPVVYDARPEDGRPFLLVGLPSNGGGFSGMNDAGVVVCVERNETLGNPELQGPPIELVVAHILRKARSTWAALEILDAYPHLQGYHVLVADPVAGGDGVPPVRVVQLGGTPRLRGPTEGVLLGANPEAPQLDDSARDRYLRLAALLAEERHLNASEVEAFLSDAEEVIAEASSVFNDRTRYSVVFEPKARRMRIAVPADAGRPGTFVTFDIQPGDTPDAGTAEDSAGGSAP